MNSFDPGAIKILKAKVPVVLLYGIQLCNYKKIHNLNFLNQYSSKHPSFDF